MLFNPKRAERHSWEMFFVGLFYASISILLVNWIFAQDVVLAKYSGILVVTFTVMFSMPFMYYTIKLEEEKDVVDGGKIGFFSLLKEHNKALKSLLWLFLGFIVGYIFLSFVFYITWATELAVRFFLPLSFVPFIILGFWLNFFEKKFKKGVWIAVAIIAVSSFFNLQKIFYTYRDLQYGGREINGDFDYLTLGEGKYVVDFVKNNTDKKTNVIDAQAGYLFKSIRSLQFLAGKENIEIIQLKKEIELNSGDRLFYLKNAENKCELSQEIAKKYDIEKCSIFRQFSIFVLKVK